MKSLILPPLSSLYGVITRTRAVLYNRGTFRAAKLPKPVISVGNITAGGTGKTPLVEWVTKTLAASGKNVCVLTRGYGRDNPKNRVIVSDGSQVFSNPDEAGDEPFLLAKNLEGIAAVISDANRFSAGQGALKHLGSNCFVLDDGFQHMQLARDLNIVTLDATDPWGGKSMLPIGTLREPLSGLKRADCIVLTRCDQALNLENIQTEAARLSGDRPIFRSKMVSRKFVPANASYSTSELSKPVGAFCGVGNPTSFITQLKELGYQPVVQKFFLDHHRYTQADVDELVELANRAGAQCLITTAKDAVKLQNLNLQLPVFFLDIEIEIDNADELRRLLIGAVS
jgi:tetraacyldisaccharide 4'-kinase